MTEATIVGFAACTSLGFTAASTLAAMTAGLNNFTATTVRDLSGEPAVAAQVVGIEPEHPRGVRLETVLRHALADLEELLPSRLAAPVPALVGVAPDLEEEERRRIVRGFDGRPLSCDLDRGWFPYGRSSTFAALRQALALLATGESDLVLVAGVDSLCGPRTLRALVAAERVLGPGTEGTIPGEACACVLLANPARYRPQDGASTWVERVALNRSATPFVGADRVFADGLTGVFRAFREAGAGRLTRVVPAHSGEGYFGRSFAHAYLRESELMPEPLDVRLTADCIGDVGAAAGIAGLAFAAHLMQTDTSGRPGRTLVYSESDSGEVGAAIVAAAAFGETVEATTSGDNRGH